MQTLQTCYRKEQHRVDKCNTVYRYLFSVRTCQLGCHSHIYTSSSPRVTYFGDVRYPHIHCRLPLYMQVAEVCIHRHCMGGAWAYIKLKMPTLIYFEQSTKCNFQQYLRLYRSATYHHPQIQPQLHCQCSPASTLALH